MKKAMMIVKHRTTQKVAAVVEYNPETGRKGKVLASEPIGDNFSNADLIAAAKRLVPQVSDRQVILPAGVEL